MKLGAAIPKSECFLFYLRFPNAVGCRNSKVRVASGDFALDPPNEVGCRNPKVRVTYEACALGLGAATPKSEWLLRCLP